MTASEINQTLFNNCTDWKEPDWSQYDALEIDPVYEDPQGAFWERLIDEPWLAQFWTVYGHVKTGGVEALTDVSTQRLATLAAARMVELAAQKGSTLDYWKSARF